MTEHLAGSNAVSETLAIHEVQRRATALLAFVTSAAGPAVPQPAVAELRDFLVGFLEHHHRCEDSDIWPVLTAADPHLATGLERLSDEHEHLDTALAELAKAEIGGSGITAAAATVRDLVHEHLSREEPVLLPAMGAHISNDHYFEIAQGIIESAPKTGLHLALGLLDDVGASAAIPLVAQHLPAEAQAELPGIRAAGAAALAGLRGTAGSDGP